MFYRNQQPNAETDSMQVDEEVRNINQANEQNVENNESRFNFNTC